MARRNGFTLLEVMIAAMVIMIGLVGIASLIPAGKFQISQALQKDMATNYGRAGLRTVMTSGYLQDEIPTTETNIRFINWRWGDTLTGFGNAADREDFACYDDMVTNEIGGARFPTYINPTYYNAEPNRDEWNKLRTNYAWAGTVRPLLFQKEKDDKNCHEYVNRGYYEVTVAVSHRLGGSTGPTSADGVFMGAGYGGGTVQLFNHPQSQTPCSTSTFRCNCDHNPPRTQCSELQCVLNVSPGEWVFVENTAAVRGLDCKNKDNHRQGHWYKVVDIAVVPNPNGQNSSDRSKDIRLLSLSGPDWTNTWTSDCDGGDHCRGAIMTVTVSTPGKVVGVFTEVMSGNTW